MPFGIKGPRAILASYLAGALAEWFEVDEDALRVNLTRDARIVLSNTRLKPGRYRRGDTVVESSGTLDEVIFSWRWFGGGKENGRPNSTGSAGGESSASAAAQKGMIQDACLSMRGGNFRLRLLQDKIGNQVSCGLVHESDAQASMSADGKGTETVKGVSKDKEKKQYVRRYIQTIIDHLTLNVTQFSLTIDLVTESKIVSIVFGGESVHLVSYGRQPEDGSLDASCSSASNKEERHALNQQIGFASIYAHVFEMSHDQDGSCSDSSAQLPLLEPFTYHAKVTRKAGERFSGIGSGLEIRGQPTNMSVNDKGKENDGGSIVVHAAQIQPLFVLQKMMMRPPAGDGATAADEAADSNDDTTAPELLDERKTRDGVSETNLDVIPSSEDSGNKDSTTFDSPTDEQTDASKSTEIVLPFSSVSLVLPDSTTLSIPLVTAICTTGGICLKLQGQCGVGLLVNDSPFLEMKCSDARLELDLLSRSFTIGPARSPQIQKVVAQITACRDKMNKVVSGIWSIVLARQAVGLRKPPKPRRFTVAICGHIGIRLEGVEHKKNQFIETCIGNLSVFLSTKERLIKSTSIAVGPCSDGKILAEIPGIYLDLFNACLRLQGTAKLELESAAILFEALSLIINSFRLRSRETAATPASKPRAWPLSISMPKIECSFLTPNMQIVVHNLSLARERTVTCDTVSYKQANGLSALLSRISADLSSTAKSIQIEAIEAMCIPGILRISEPVVNTTLCFEDDSLTVNLAAVHIESLRFQKPGKKGEQSPKKEVKIPWRVRVIIQEVHVENPIGGAQVRQADVEIEPAEVMVLTRGPYECIGSSGLHIRIRRIAEFDHGMFQLRDMSANAVINIAQPSVIQSFKFDASLLRITAGFSSVDWKKAVFGGKADQPKTVIHLPHARVGALKVQVKYKGHVCSGRETAIDLDHFVGDLKTTLDDMVQFYLRGAFNGVPNFISNAEVFVSGEDFVDSIFSTTKSKGSTTGLSLAEGKVSSNIVKDALETMSEVKTMNVSEAASAISETAKSNVSKLRAVGVDQVGTTIGMTVAGMTGYKAIKLMKDKVVEKVEKATTQNNHAA